MQVHGLLNFIFGQAKLAIWLSQKRKLIGLVLTDRYLFFRELIKSCIKIENVFYKLIDYLDNFRSKWCINQSLCEVGHNGCLEILV